MSDLFHVLDLGMLPISVILPRLPIPAHLRRDQARKQLRDVFRSIISNRRANGVRENDALQVWAFSSPRPLQVLSRRILRFSPGGYTKPLLHLLLSKNLDCGCVLGSPG